jgi:hypothetical protein
LIDFTTVAFCQFEPFSSNVNKLHIDGKAFEEQKITPSTMFAFSIILSLKKSEGDLENYN